MIDVMVVYLVFKYLVKDVKMIEEEIKKVEVK